MVAIQGYLVNFVDKVSLNFVQEIPCVARELSAKLTSCTHCGKHFTDKWAESIARKTFNVKHRHVVLTMPDILEWILNCKAKTWSDSCSAHIRKLFTFGEEVIS